MKKVILSFGIPLTVASLIGLTHMHYEGQTTNSISAVSIYMVYGLLIGLAAFTSFGKEEAKKSVRRIKKVTSRKVRSFNKTKAAPMKVVVVKVPLSITLKKTPANIVRMKIQEMVQN